jgi:signal transduction histidine kinase
VRWRLVAVLVGIVAVVLLVQDVPLAFHLERVERDRLETGLARDAYVWAGRSEEVLEEGTPRERAALGRALAAYAARTGATVIVTDLNGTAVATSAPEVVGEPYANRPEVAAAVRGRFAAGERDSHSLGEPLVYVAVPVRSGELLLGAVRLTYPASVIERRVGSRLRSLAAGAAVSIAAALAVAVVVAATVARPLRRLRSATDALAGGDLSARARSAGGPPEVRALAASFDDMATRIEDMVSAQRAFVADASHQLRTPLTALRLRIDQAAELVEHDPAAARLRLDAAAGEIDRLARLTEGLLTLARADADTEPLEVDVAAVARERVAVWRPLAEERGVDLEVTAPPVALALAVAGAVEQIVDGYVDNALEVAPAGSVLWVQVASRAREVVLHVIDAGPGLDDAQRERAFDRLWQAGGARSGSGLGLAIIRRLATAGGGTVELRRAPAGGIDAVATFPAPRGTRAPTPAEPVRAADAPAPAPAAP